MNNFVNKDSFAHPPVRIKHFWNRIDTPESSDERQSVRQQRTLSRQPHGLTNHEVMRQFKVVAARTGTKYETCLKYTSTRYATFILYLRWTDWFLRFVMALEMQSLSNNFPSNCFRLFLGCRTRNGHRNRSNIFSVFQDISLVASNVCLYCIGRFLVW